MNSEHLLNKDREKCDPKAGTFLSGLSLNIFYLLKCAKRIRNKLNKLMKSPPIYNKSPWHII